MREVYSDQEPARVGHFQSILEEAGIPCFVRNQYANANLTGILGPSFFPILCVRDDQDYERAVTLIRETIQEVDITISPEWQCPKCKEQVPAGFGVCWNCQYALENNSSSGNTESQIS